MISTINIAQLFNGLQEEIWRQYIDLEHQPYGKHVYDTGAHKGDKEPGFLNSILEAHNHTSKLLGIKMNAQHYEEIHHKAMQHAERYQEAHEFRLNQSFCPFARVNFEEGFIDGIDKEVTPKLFPYQDDYDKEKLEKESKRANEKIDAKKMNTMYFRFSFSYGRGEREKIGLKINQIFDTLEKDIQELESLKEEPQILKKKKLYRICRFLKEIEFLHPYIDGNSRVNYVILNKVLVENGFTPVLVSDINIPYSKKLSTVLTWLEQGLKRWQAVANAISNSEDIEQTLVGFDEKYKEELVTTRALLYKSINSSSF